MAQKAKLLMRMRGRLEMGGREGVVFLGFSPVFGDRRRREAKERDARSLLL